MLSAGVTRILASSRRAAGIYSKLDRQSLRQHQSIACNGSRPQQRIKSSLLRASKNHSHLSRQRRQWMTTKVAEKATTSSSSIPMRKVVWKEISSRPIEFLSIPCVAAFVGILTNWMGVKMLFYPVEYFGIDLKRWDNTPYGIIGWQGVVPTKTETMAKRLVRIVTDKLLSLDEAFARLGTSE